MPPLSFRASAAAPPTVRRALSPLLGVLAPYGRRFGERHHGGGSFCGGGKIDDGRARDRVITLKPASIGDFDVNAPEMPSS